MNYIIRQATKADSISIARFFCMALHREPSADELPEFAKIAEREDVLYSYRNALMAEIEKLNIKYLDGKISKNKYKESFNRLKKQLLKVSKLGKYIRTAYEASKKFNGEIYVTKENNYDNIFSGISIDKGVVAGTTTKAVSQTSAIARCVIMLCSGIKESVPGVSTIINPFLRIKDG